MERPLRVAIFNDFDLDYVKKSLPTLEVVDLSRGPDAILVRSEDLKKKELPESVTAIIRAGTGVDNIPIDWCSDHGISVFNTPRTNSNAVKELVIWALITASRNTDLASRVVSQALQENREKKDVPDWEKLKGCYRGTELSGKKILVIGLGAIGSLVANACQGLGMSVVGYDPYLPREKAAFPMLAQLYALHDFDYITLHAELTAKTKGFIDKDTLRYRVKKGVKLINFARKDLIDSQALRQALEMGWIDMYISDFIDYSLAHMVPARVIFLPHLGASTHEAERRSLEMAIRQLGNFWNEGIIENSVNFPACSLERGGDFRLLVANKDQPGVIAKFCQVLGESGCNVANMVNKRNEQRGIAYNIVDIDQRPERPEELAAKIAKLEGVTKVRYI